MFDADDILIVGDSFVGSRTEDTDWPKLLTKLLTEQDVIPKGKGFNGCSWWSARQYLLNELKHSKPKLLILSHTEPMRLPNDDNLSLNATTVEQEDWFKKDNPNTPDDIRKAARDYYKYLQSFDFHLWSQKQWYIELDRILDDAKIPFVVHLHCFLPWHNEPLYEFKHGITFDKPLWELSDDIKQWSNNNRNHFSIENNKLLANAIYEAIKTYSNGMRNLVL